MLKAQLEVAACITRLSLVATSGCLEATESLVSCDLGYVVLLILDGLLKLE